MGFPVDMSGVKFYAEVLSKYYESQPAYTILLFSAIYLFKQSFCIPGSALLVSKPTLLYSRKVI